MEARGKAAGISGQRVDSGWEGEYSPKVECGDLRENGLDIMIRRTEDGYAKCGFTVGKQNLSQTGEGGTWLLPFRHEALWKRSFKEEPDD